MRTADRTLQAWRLRGQNVSRRTPNGCGSAAKIPPPETPALSGGTLTPPGANPPPLLSSIPNAGVG